MGRTVKPGISFYRMDAGHIQNKKVRLLFNEFDSDGYYIWHCLIDYAYTHWGYYFDMNDVDGLELFASEYCKKPLGAIKEVIAGCIRRDLFDQAVADMFGVLTSEMMQETFLVATSERRAKDSVFDMRKDWLLLDFSQELPRNISIVPGKNVILPGKKTILPPKNPQKRGEKKRIREEENRKKESSAPASPAPPKSLGKEEEKEPHWQQLVDTWFTFYKKNFNQEEPSFAGRDPRLFKSIVQGLRKRAERKNIEWTVDNATKSLLFFLTCAFSEDWLSKHFLLKNLAEQFDAVFQRQASGKNVPTVSAPVGSQEVQYLYDRFLEDSLDKKQLEEKHFDYLRDLELIDLDERFIQQAVKMRIDSLIGSNQAREIKIVDAYQSGKWPSDPDCQADEPNRIRIAKKFALIDYFRKSKMLGQKIITEAKPADIC